MIQPVLLDQLFDSKHVKTKKVKNLDFLLELLKNIDDKKVIKDLILHSNIDEKSKEFLFNKFHINLKSKATFNKISKSKYILNKKSVKLDNKEFKLLNSENNKIKNNFSKEIKISEKKPLILTSLLQDIKDDKGLETIIEKLPLKQQLKIVKEIKNILVSKIKNNKQIEVLVNTKEFKNVTNIKELINLSKKFKLNITKIVLKQENIKSNENIFSFVKDLNKNIKIQTQKSIQFSSKSSNNENHIKALQVSLNKILSFENNNKTFDMNLNNKSHISTTKKDFISKEISLNTLLSDIKKENNKELKEDKINDPNLGININTEFKSKIIEAKQSIKHFVSSLKEAVESYKPPLTKLSLELHPKELGKVEVVIKQQGDNLNVQINTQNQTTINFLTSQQNELKNSLVNMGFTNINMNFNSNHQNQKHNQHKNQYTNSNTDENNEELVIDFSYKYA